MSRLSHAAALAVILPLPALAEAPRVVADIAPVQGLVARVMDGVGTPALLIPPGASPHSHAMKPSHARALSDAQAVFMVGPDLTPWLLKPVETLAPQASHIVLMDAPGTLRLPNRTGETFETHGHHEDHAPEAAEAGHAHHESEAGTDPHAWLDPENGKLWLSAIAAELSRIDPANAPAYAANAARGAVEIDAARTDVQTALAAGQTPRFIVFHDAYQYMEHRFGLSAAGSISLGDATPPGPARVAQLRDKVAALGIDCAFSEPQFNADLLRTVFGGSNARMAVIDPLGTTIPEGPDFYPALIRSVGEALATCE
ncbi:zinc ABC transporter substrate-binding protein [Paracoccus marinus]|uniref:zinc ABC transporter substrate-binding protein n=1 Tax=Paracoccus marinus TaxID=288426 RepID=UPI00103DCE59|nr:zinc ABC transporter substrate-binding protein [Paracoccus marinus]GLS81336.1 zinc transporter [Paracoccus marinus]